MRITFSLLLFLGIFTSLAAQNPEPPAKLANSDVYKVVDQMPRFYDEKCSEEFTRESQNCCQIALLSYVYGNLKYPAEAKAQQVEGMAVISFTVDADGWIYDPKIVRNPGAGTGEEALRVIKKMMDDVQWWPGIQNGKPVDVSFNIPIKFALPREKKVTEWNFGTKKSKKKKKAKKKDGNN